MLKKVLAGIAAAALALSLSACGGAAVKLPDLSMDTSSTASGVEVVRKKPDASGYGDSLLDLMTYMEDGKAVARDTAAVTFGDGTVSTAEGVTSFVQMSYQEIGAEDGYRYQFIYNGSSVQAEFYEFDPQNLDEKAKGYVSSVKEKGFFEILDQQVEAVLHPSGKYLMVYMDPNAEKNEENRAQKEWAQELFLDFPAE